MLKRLVLLVLSIAQLGWAQKEIVDPEAVSAGLKTALMLERPPCAYRITWVDWDSPFRGQAQIGDRVIAINGEAVPCVGYISNTIKQKAEMDKLRELTQRGLGGLSEHQTWKDKGLKEGSPLVLTVLRRGKEQGMESLELRGSLRARRDYFAADGKPTFGLNGPAKITNDGLGNAWSSWYEGFARRIERVLDGGLQSRINTRQLLAEHLQDQPRLELLGKKYPGGFAKAVIEDWEQVRRVLEGNPYTLGEKDLEYRQSGERLVARIAEESQKARAALVQRLVKDTITPFPTIDPIKDDRSKVTGKVVVLEPIGLRDWVSEAGRCYLTSGNPQQGFYFVDCASANTQRMIAARYRYLGSVSPQLGEGFAVIGRITGNPKMLVMGGRAVTGLELEPIAATIGDKVFVDLTEKQGSISLFVGEAQLSIPQAIPPNQASPQQVMQALIQALKTGNEATWKALFAQWAAERLDDNQIRYRPNLAYGTGSMGEDWVRSRRLITSSLYDVRVAYIGEIETLLTGKEYEGAVLIEQITIELEHIGRFGDQYRSFVDINVQRVWKLQRVDKGPWQITSIQGI